MRDLGHFPKGEPPLFTDYLTFPLVLVVISAVVLSFIAFGAPEMERQAKVQQESAYVVR